MSEVTMKYNESKTCEFVLKNHLKNTASSGYQAATVAILLIGLPIAGVSTMMVGNRLTEISKKRKQCEVQYLQRVEECQKKVEEIKSLCLKNSKISYDLCNEKAEGKMQ